MTILPPIFLFTFWLGLITYAIALAPPDRPDTLDLIIKLSTGQWDGLNPFIIALFNLMGIWPVIYSAVLLFDGRGQRIPAWPFVLGSFALGAFALLPYLALRKPNPSFLGEKGWLLKLLDSRWLGLILLLATLFLLGYGIGQGDWADFLTQWRSSRFIHVMSLDFVALSLLFPIVLKDDLARRGLKNNFLFWAIALIPLIAPCWYLATRQEIVRVELNSQKVC
jgi:hypothetical protein